MERSTAIAESDAPQVVIVGGGIAGLATAYFLEQSDPTGAVRCTVLEGSTHAGGKIRTEEVDGFVVEAGPDSLYAAKPAALELCRALGLEDEILPDNAERRRTFVLRAGKLLALPEGLELLVPTRIAPFLISPLFSLSGKARMAMEPLLPRRTDEVDESVAEFVTRRLGKEALERMAGPLLSGIHAADPARQSLLATFPALRRMESEHGSLLRGVLATRARQQEPDAGASRRARPSFLTLRGGLGDLVAALLAGLRRTRVRVGARVGRLDRLRGADEFAGRGGGTGTARAAPPPRAFRVELADGTTLAADAVVLAVPARESARLLADVAPALSRRLGALGAVTTANVSLGFRDEDVPHPMEGFGFLVPRSEHRDVFACTWTSSKFAHRAPAGMRLLRVFVGGTGREAFALREDRDVVAVVRRELGDVMGITAEPVVTRVFRWVEGQPQYEVGHLVRVHEIDWLARRESGLFLAGSALHGVAIPDCVADAKRCAAAATEYVAAQRAARGV
jgi:oxygen-dependent protoporphyrinogen oxidase